MLHLRLPHFAARPDKPDFQEQGLLHGGAMSQSLPYQLLQCNVGGRPRTCLSRYDQQQLRKLADCWVMAEAVPKVGCST
jgi:hypothetical protein